jgi:hypothetical protein
VIEYAGAIFLVIGFIFILGITGLVEKSTRVIDIAKQAVTELRDSELSDDDKELAMQSHAKQLGKLFLLITLGGLAAVFLPLAVILGLDRLTLISIDAVLDVALSWSFLGVTTVLMVVALVIKRAR